MIAFQVRLQNPLFAVGVLQHQQRTAGLYHVCMLLSRREGEGKGGLSALTFEAQAKTALPCRGLIYT